MIEIKALEPKASWLHCTLCGEDDQGAADWQITADSYAEGKYHPKKVGLLVCNDCMRDVLQKIVAVGVELEEPPKEET